MLPSQSVYNNYDISVVDRSRDGVIILKFVDKITEYSILLINCYLPPENSLYGRDAVGFFCTYSRIYLSIQ